MSREAACVSSVIELRHEGGWLSEIASDKGSTADIANQPIPGRIDCERNAICEVYRALRHGNRSTRQQHKEWNQFLHIVSLFGFSCF
jgi:hypothetical protein